jgi:hypothetical protein
VAYKDFFEQVAVPESQQRNEIFAFSRASAEKVGDIIEFWLGVLEIATMTKRWSTFSKRRSTPPNS